MYRPTARSRASKFSARRSIVASSGVALLLLANNAYAQDDPSVDEELRALEAEAEAEAEAEEAESTEAAAEPAAASEQAPEAAKLEADAVAEAPPAPAPESEPADDRDEVVVTVDRRTKSLQDYSGVAASFSENKLQSVGITNARDLSSMVPGLQIGVQEGNTEIYIRGVGSDNNTELGDPAVALHIDGVYIPRPRGVGSMFFDIARVEVSSGPQGTLRGRNAMGGTVNIVSNRPKLGTFEANGEATFGTFSQRRYQGMVNLPVGDVLAFRFAGFSEIRDSYYINGGPLHDITPAENADAFAYRAQMIYQPTPSFTALIGYDRTQERGTGYLGANFQGQLTEIDRTGDDGPVGVPFSIADVDNPRRVYYRGMNPSVDLLHEGYRLELTYETAPATFQAAASYRNLRYQQVTGANAGAVTEGFGFDGVNPDVFTNGFWDTTSQSLIAELRAFAPDDARFRWTAGAFFFDEDQTAFLGQVSDPANGFGGGEFNMPDVKGGSIAGYVDGTFDITDKLRVFAGYRLTLEEKSRNGGLWMLLQGFPNGGRYGTEGFQFEGQDRTNYEWADDDGDGVPDDTTENRVNLFLDGIKSFGARDELPQALCNDPVEGQPRVIPNPSGSGLRCAAGVNVAGLNSSIGNAVPQNNEVDNLFHDWRVGVEYDLADDNLLYASVTTGHKAGGFNDTSPGLPGEFFNSEYAPEDVLSFELGSKNVLFDRSLRVNASAFMYLYTNLVFQTIASAVDEDNLDDTQGGPSAAVRQNAPDTTGMLGLDLDVNLRLPAGLEAEAHLLVMDAKFNDGTLVTDTRISNVASENYEVDLGGNWIPRVSRYTLNFALSQLIFSPVGAFNWVVQGQTRSQHYMSVFNGEGELLAPASGVEPTSVPYAILSLPNGAQRLTDVVPTYTRFDIGAGWKHPDGRIAVNGFVNNVFNVAYSTSIISTPGLNLRFFNPPRTAGVRMRVDW